MLGLRGREKFSTAPEPSITGELSVWYDFVVDEDGVSGRNCAPTLPCSRGGKSRIEGLDGTDGCRSVEKGCEDRPGKAEGWNRPPSDVLGSVVGSLRLDDESYFTAELPFSSESHRGETGEMGRAGNCGTDGDSGAKDAGAGISSTPS